MTCKNVKAENVKNQPHVITDSGEIDCEYPVASEEEIICIPRPRYNYTQIQTSGCRLPGPDAISFVQREE